MQDMVCVCKKNAVTFIQLNKMVKVYDRQWDCGLFKVKMNNFINYVLRIIIIVIIPGCEQMIYDSWAVSKYMNRVYCCDTIKITTQFISLFMEHIILIGLRSKQT